MKIDILGSHPRKSRSLIQSKQLGNETIVFAAILVGTSNAHDYFSPLPQLGSNTTHTHTHTHTYTHVTLDNNVLNKDLAKINNKLKESSENNKGKLQKNDL